MSVMSHRFEILRGIRREYRRFNDRYPTDGASESPIPPPTPILWDHFLASVNDLFEHALQDVGDGNMVGIAIHNESNQNKPKGINFRRRDQLSVDAIWSVFEVTVKL